MTGLVASVCLAILVPLTDETAKRKEQAEATLMLAEARTARAVISNFGGMTADVILTIGSKEYRGVVQVDSQGKVVIGEIVGQNAAWAKRVLASAISHRLSNPKAEKTQCAFADEDKTHPLGRLVNLLNDGMHSSYRIRDNQIMVVNRLKDGVKFSITVQENMKNEEGKYLPVAYSVHHWSQDGALEKTEAHTQGWVRMNGMDLPKLIRVVTVSKEVDAREIRLENIKLVSVK